MDAKEYLRKALSYDRSGDQYASLVVRMETDPNLLKLLHSVLGMSGEVGEATDSVKKAVMYGKTLDIVNLKEECGDILWYMSLMLHAIGSSFEEVMAMNDAKLARRYPQGFTELHAQLRLDKTTCERCTTIVNLVGGTELVRCESCRARSIKYEP